ncbi:MAG: hypothetical protein QM820_62125 [Minicystis sp.]
MNLHPYDGITRRFRHTDEDPREGLDLIARLLGLPQPPAPDRALYDLSFYSGGIGVVDRLALTVHVTPAIWAHVASAMDAVAPEEAEMAPEWADELAWLFTGEEERVPLRPAAVAFINGERRDFQAECSPADRILIVQESGVNHWNVLWGTDQRLNHLGYDQG